MKAFENGNPELCTANLLKIGRGEVPFDRIKGLDRSVIDLPAAQAKSEIIEDSRWIIEAYEPRVKLNSIDISQGNNLIASIHADVTVKENKT